MKTLLVAIILATIMALVTAVSPDAQAGDASLRHSNPPIVLTSSVPAYEGTAKIVAPGNRLQNYTVFPVDVTAFPGGGVLVIDIQISPDSQTDGSFDLFPEHAPIPVEGGPHDSVAGSYDIRRGHATQLRHRFDKGSRFNFGATGNWFSPTGNHGSIEFRVFVESEQYQSAH